MKRITIMMFALATSFVFNANAQDATTAEMVLTQTSGVIGDGGVACGDQGAGTTGDNFYARSYNLAENGVSDAVQVVGIEFNVGSSTGESELEVMVFDYVGFPTGFFVDDMPQALATGTVTVDPSMVGTMVRVDFDTPGVANQDSNLVAVVFEPDGQNFAFYIGTAAEETYPSYLGSVACEIFEPVTVEVIGFPDSKHIINLILDDVLSVDQNLAGMVSVYPNPTSDVLNIQTPSSVDVTSVVLFDILGKKVNADYNNSAINMTSLSQGVYILKVETSAGTLTQKVVKQ